VNAERDDISLSFEEITVAKAPSVNENAKEIQKPQDRSQTTEESRLQSRLLKQYRRLKI
jgi:hypothetical protein